VLRQILVLRPCADHCWGIRPPSEVPVHAVHHRRAQL